MDKKRIRVLREEIVQKLSELKPKQIWRPVYGHWGALLMPGHYPDDRLLYSTPGLDFSGKSVVDIGCNLGFYTFQFKRLGASKVLGVDSAPEVIEVANLLCEYHQSQGVDFQIANITEQELNQRFDMAVMINVLGKNTISKGRMPAFLDCMAKTAEKEMFFTIRPIYLLKKHDLGPLEELDRMYPGGYIRDNRFHALEYVRDYFEGEWKMRFPSDEDDWSQGYKYATLFERI